MDSNERLSNASCQRVRWCTSRYLSSITTKAFVWTLIAKDSEVVAFAMGTVSSPNLYSKSVPRPPALYGREQDVNIPWRSVDAQDFFSHPKYTGCSHATYGVSLVDPPTRAAVDAVSYPEKRAFRSPHHHFRSDRFHLHRVVDSFASRCDHYSPKEPHTRHSSISCNDSSCAPSIRVER